MLIYLLILVIGLEAKALVVFKGVEVNGDDMARIIFLFEPKKEVPPLLHINGNVVELSFQSVKFDEKLGEKIDISSPHLLIKRINAFSSNGGLKVNIVLNGSVENLRKRLKLENHEKGIALNVAFPEKPDATLTLLRDEETALSTISVEPTKFHPKYKDIMFYLSVLALFFIGIVGILFFVKRKGRIGGSRKYLVEHMSYCPLGGGKAGVSVIKVGSEFFLIGVTSNQVTFLSALPKLGLQYEQETNFERSCFREAIEEEYKRIKSNLTKPITKSIV